MFNYCKEEKAIPRWVSIRERTQCLRLNIHFVHVFILRNIYWCGVSIFYFTDFSLLHFMYWSMSVEITTALKL